MAGNLNKVLLMGNLTRDVETRTINGATLGSFGLAMNRRYRDRSGEYKEEPTFVDCVAWGKTAEVLAQYLSKGRPVFVEGRLQLDQWMDTDGKKHSRLKVVVEAFQFIDSRNSDGSSKQGDPIGVAKDDIPF